MASSGLKTDALPDSDLVGTCTTIVDLVDTDSCYDEETIPISNTPHRSVSALLRSGPRGTREFQRAHKVHSPTDMNKSIPRRRVRLSENYNQFKLFNLSLTTTVETIKQSMKTADIPMHA